MVGAVGILRWSAMGLLGSGVICGTLLALDRFDADARSRDTVQLLELLDAAPVPGGHTRSMFPPQKPLGLPPSSFKASELVC